MALFRKAENTQAYAKVGLMGFAGSGKTFTATQIAIGLIGMMRGSNLAQGRKPAYFLDTETGSDWAQPFFDRAGVELFSAKTRAFTDLLGAIEEAENNGAVLLIDSITHFWRELCDSYAKQKKRNRLQFEDWAWLKQQWGKFTDAFVNSQIHIILCGRAGYEYDYFEDDVGKKQLEKTGIKMKAEGETGYEPSLLILMEREMDMETKRVHRVASILKDRSTRIDGQQIKNPTFADFLPHFEFLNLGGAQLGVDLTRNSMDLIPPGERPAWELERKQTAVLLDETKELLNKHHGGASTEAKKAKGDLLEAHFGTRSWVRIEETYRLPQIRKGYDALRAVLEPALADSPDPTTPQGLA